MWPINAVRRNYLALPVRRPSIARRVEAARLQGTEDRVHSIAAAEAQANAIPGARLQLINGMGHDILPEHLAEVSDLFLSFLRSA